MAVAVAVLALVLPNGCRGALVRESNVAMAVLVLVLVSVLVLVLLLVWCWW